MNSRVPVRADIEPLLAAIRSRFVAVQGTWLFGSLARDEARPDSDIDLAIFAPTPLDPVAVFDLGLELGNLAGRDVDLIDMRRASTILRKEIVCEGVLVDARDPTACEAFAADAIALYVAFQDERRLVLAAGDGGQRS